MKLHAVLTGRH